MSQAPTPSRRSLARWFLLAAGAGLLGTALVLSAWELREILWPRKLDVALDRTLNPGRFEDRAPWANAEALGVVRRLGTVVSEWDTSGTSLERTIHLTVHEDLPLEEAGHRLARALDEAGLEVVDAVEIQAGERSRGLELLYGLDGRRTGKLLVSAWRRPPGDDRPRVALVLDDLGRHPPEEMTPFFTMGAPIAATILPGLRYTAAVARQAGALGHDVALHLPMEPLGYPRADPGKEAVLVDMSPSEIRKLVMKHLATVPGAVAISNHMGSMATQDRATMSAVFDVVERESLYFIDSHTTPRSIAPKIARERRVPCVQNDLFLDNQREPEEIRRRMAELVALAKRDGCAVGIFHPHAVCAETLPGEVERYAAEGVRFVGLQDLAKSRWHGALPPSRARDPLP